MKRVVLITGCFRGLGKLLAETLAKKNFLVYAGVRLEEEAEKLRPVWKDARLSAFPIKLDVTSDVDCRKAIAKIIAKEKHLDILINNAAYTLTGPTTGFAVQEYLDILNTNAAGAFRLIKELVSQSRLKKEIRIVNITSLNGLIALPNFGLYCSSKFALEGLALSLRHELMRDNIWITNLEPGAICRKKEEAEKTDKNLPHIPARERFWIIGKLMPMISEEKFAETVENIINKPRPPAQVILGKDALILTFIMKFLPKKIWDYLLEFVWQRQGKK